MMKTRDRVPRQHDPTLTKRVENETGTDIVDPRPFYDVPSRDCEVPLVPSVEHPCRAARSPARRRRPPCSCSIPYG